MTPRPSHEPRDPSEGRRRDDAGFTLLELIVALGLMALILAVTLPTLRDQRNRVRLQPLAAQLITDLKRARTAAMTAGKPATFIVEPATHSYRVEGVTRSTILPAAAALSLTVSTEGLRPSPAGRVIFYPDGSSTGGRLSLGDGSGRSVVLTIQWLTGAITQTENAK